MRPKGDSVYVTVCLDGYVMFAFEVRERKAQQTRFLGLYMFFASDFKLRPRM
jgi:hypothetical protein